MGSASHIGDCRLCLASGVPLNDSHILPKWSYRRATDQTRSLGFGDPVQSDGETVIVSSSQVKEYLLCDSCEARLGDDEDHVARLAGQPDGRLGLLDHVTSVPGPRPGMKVAALRQSDAQALARFAASVFWRASVSTKKECKGLRLWKEHAEVLRQFVLTLRGLPSGMCLLLSALVGEDGKPSSHGRSSAFPTSYRSGEDGWHQFLVAGLVFTMAMGSKIGETGRVGLTGPDPHVVFRTWQQVAFMVATTNALMSATPKGKLAGLRKPTR